MLPTPPVATRKRKCAHQYTVSSEVQEVDTDGRLREIIVIEDTPPPPTASPVTSSRTNGYSAPYQPPAYSTPIRTRARAAMEAQTDSSGSLSAALPIPAPKKRKRELADSASASAWETELEKTQIRAWTLHVHHAPRSPPERLAVVPVACRIWPVPTQSQGEAE